MTSPLTLPVARLRAAGCKVQTIIGHDPLTTGAHPRFSPNWHYGIVPPKPVDIEDAFFSYDRSLSTRRGNAVVYNFRDGRIMLNARAGMSEDWTPSRRRAERKAVEADVAALLSDVATVISNGRI